MYKKSSSDFISQSVRCSGDLYLPVDIDDPPIVIMAHGFAAERSFRLPAYAEYFANAGLAVYLFDYRSFGDSEGELRHYVDHRRHLQDWIAAIDHVRSLPGINPHNIALWGTSFSGGHVIVSAANDRNISAIVAQVPHVDSITTIQKLGIRYVLQAIPHGIRDILRAITLRSPHYIKVIGSRDEFAALNTPECLPGYSSIIPEVSAWENECLARIVLIFPFYRPITSAPNVICPALLMIAENDSLIDVKAVQKTAARMPHCTVLKYPIGHFDIYIGSDFEDAVFTQTEFLKKHLCK